MIFKEVYKISERTGLAFKIEGKGVWYKVKNGTLHRFPPNGNYWYPDGDYVLSYCPDDRNSDKWEIVE